MRYKIDTAKSETWFKCSLCTDVRQSIPFHSRPSNVKKSPCLVCGATYNGPCVC